MKPALQKIWRRTIALAIVALSLCEGAAALIPVLTAAEQNCGMACCRRMKSCCCRKGGRHEAGSAKPQFRAGAACGADCRLQAALPQLRPCITGTSEPRILPAAMCGMLDTRQPAPGFSIAAGFALFERPPPASS